MTTNLVVKNQRFRSFLEWLKANRKIFNNSDFALIVDKKPSYISECVNDKRIVSEKFMLVIKSKFPELNLKWMISGDGEMLCEEGAPALAKKDSYSSVVLESKESDLINIIIKQQETIASLTRTVEHLTSDR